jgi:hypothetical protein
MKPNDITIPSIWDEYYRQRDRNDEQRQTTTEGDDNRSTSSRSLHADDDDDASHDSGAFSSSLNSTTTGSSAPVHPGSDPQLRSTRNHDFLSVYERIVRHLHDNRRMRISNSSSSPHRRPLQRVGRNWSSASLLELINAALAVTADFSNDNDDDTTMIVEGVDGTGERHTHHDDDGQDQR